MSLLSKWRWRLLDNSEGVWKDVIRSKYGNLAVGKVELGEVCKPWYASLWWRDICSIGSNLGINWFSLNVFKKVGNGRLTSFWWDTWIGDSPLKDRFPRLFSISNQQLASVNELCITDGGAVRWNFSWRRQFFVWENELFDNLKGVINGVLLSNDDDRWCWRPEKDATFSVKSAYSLVFNWSNPSAGITKWQGKIFNEIWKCPTPSKVIGFV
jgi:hypothetical protein